MLDNRNEKLIEPMDNRIEELMNTSNKYKKNKELGTENRTHSLFFAPESEKKDFQTVLKEVQEYISSNYSVLITDQGLEDAKEQMKRYISKYVMDERIAVKGMEGQELVDALPVVYGIRKCYSRL